MTAFTRKCCFGWGALLTLALWGSTARAADIFITGQNEVRYGRGSQPDADRYNFFENYMELTSGIDRFRFHLRQSYKLPSEFGVRQTGWDAFDRKYIEYSGDRMTVRGGDFYRLRGRGLLFGAVELVELGFDSGLEGVLVESSIGRFEGAVFRGVETDSVGEFAEAAEGAWGLYRLPNGVQIGAGYNYLEDGPRHPAIGRAGIEVETGVGSGELFAAYTSDRLDLEDNEYHHGFYGAASLFGIGWGLLFDYKNYRLLPCLQFPPTAIPEATMTLLDRHPRQPSLSDDVGWQLEVTLSRGYWDLRLNYNQSSEHAAAWPDLESILPRMEEEFSPYQGLFLRLERDDYVKDRFVIQGGFNEDVEFIHTPAGGFSNWFQRIGGGVIYERRLPDNYSVTGEVEYINVEKNGTHGREFREELFSLSVSRAPNLSTTGNIEFANNEGEVGGVDWPEWLNGGPNDRYWTSSELTLNLFERHQLTLFYGHERGGLRCSGGFCRWVEPFKGVKMTLISQF